MRLKPKPYSIQRRLLLWQSALLLAALWLMAASAALNLRSERELSQVLSDLHTEMLLRGQMEDELGVMLAGARALVLDPNSADRGIAPEAAERLRNLHESYLRQGPSAEERIRAARVREGFEALAASVEALSRAGPDDAAVEEAVRDLIRRDTALRSEMLGWSRVQTDRLAAMGEALTGRSATLYSLLAGFALFAFLGVFLFHRAQARHLWTPLEAMRRMVLELKRGNLETPAPHADSVELRPLAEALGEMATEVAETRHRLEQKVEERTARLEQAQQQLLRTARLTALGELVAGVAHEVNNPLTSILGFSDILLARCGLDPRLRPQVETIRGEALRLKNVVANLTGYAELSRPRLSRFDLHSLYERLADLRVYHLRVGRIRLEFVACSSPLWVQGDADLLLQALFSMVLNAEQAIHDVRERGTIRIEAARQGDRVRVSVCDDGSGMDAATQARIFEPFFTTRPAGRGTGMGLTVARAIVEQHHGRIEVESAPGKGSRFTFTLPSGEPPPAPAASPHWAAAGERAGECPRALLVDDEKGILDLTAHALSARGWQCTALNETGNLAGILAGADFDVVLCDLRMPGMSGLDVLRLLRRELPPLASRFILMTGDPSDLGADAAEFAGVEMLRKPFTLAQLYAAVDAVAAR